MHQLYIQIFCIRHQLLPEFSFHRFQETSITDVYYFSSDTWALLTIIHQFIDLQLCFEMLTLVNAAQTFILMMFSFTLDIYCTSLRPGRGILTCGSLWGFYVLLMLLKCFFSSFSLLLLRVKGRGCHTMLKPYETHWDLWIWAIQIKFYWLIDWCNTQRGKLKTTTSYGICLHIGFEGVVWH